MKLKTLFIINVFIAGGFGLAWVFIPLTAISLYEVNLNPGGVIFGQLFGAALLGYAVLAWFGRNVGESEASKGILLALFVNDTVGFVVALLAQLSGVINWLGWSTVIIYLLLALGYGYFIFFKPSAS